MLRAKIKKLPWSLLALVSLFLVMIAGAFKPGLLEAEALSDFFADIGTSNSVVVSDEALAKMEVLDTGWECDEEGRPCTRVLINGSESLICLPSETKDDLLMVPLKHFSLVAGCTLEIGEDKIIHLTKDNQTYVMEANSPWLISGDDIWTFPAQPYEAHENIYVPLRFLCSIMNINVQWHDKSDTVLLDSHDVEAEALVPSLAAENANLLAALEGEEGPKLGEPIEITITFYYSSAKQAWTASGNEAVAGSIAADSSVPFGTQYYIPGLDFIREDCIFTVHDRGSAVKGNVVDVYLPSSVRGLSETKAALRVGRYTTTAQPIIPEAE